MIHVLIDRLIEREGGYVNRSTDRGGPTNMGITMETLTEYRGYPVTIEDVQDLTHDEAARIYYDRYWVKPGFIGLALSDVLDEMLLDAAAHHGPVGAVKLLQKALRVKVDGKVGPVTREAVQTMSGPILAANLMAERVAKLGAIIGNDHTQSEYAAGWMNRMREFIQKIPYA